MSKSIITSEQPTTSALVKYLIEQLLCVGHCDFCHLRTWCPGNTLHVVFSHR